MNGHYVVLFVLVPAGLALQMLLETHRWQSAAMVAGFYYLLLLGALMALGSRR